MRKYGLIGYPLGHSFSAKYFADKFTREGINDCIYTNYPLECLDEFREMIAGDSELCGLNVTIPYKTEIIRYIDLTERIIDEISAVNVLKINRSKGKQVISGFNSDITGIEASLKPYLTGDLRKALILGTGGSSKAVAFVLKHAGIEFLYVSRKRKKGCITYADLSSGLLRDTFLIINTTPVGMFPHSESLPVIDYSRLNEKHILFDLVYNPEITSFLKKGQERGCRIVTGLQMLYAQADRSWEIWNDPGL